MSISFNADVLNNMSDDYDLSDVRKEIDGIDRQILDLFVQLCSEQAGTFVPSLQQSSVIPGFVQLCSEGGGKFAPSPQQSSKILGFVQFCSEGGGTFALSPQQSSEILGFVQLCSEGGGKFAPSPQQSSEVTSPPAFSALQPPVRCRLRQLSHTIRQQGP